jgi:glutamate--cysteine ligase
MKRDYANSFVRFVLEHSIRHRDAIMKLLLDSEVAERYSQLARESVAKQRQIEAADNVSFETYVQRYLSPERLTVG